MLITLAWRTTSFLGVTFAILGSLFYIESVIDATVVYFGAVVVSMICLGIMFYNKNYKLVFLIYCLMAVIAPLFSLIYLSTEVHFVDFLWILAGISMAYFTYNKLFSFALLIFSILGVYVFIFYSYNHQIEVAEVRNFSGQISLFIEITAGLCVNFYLFYLYYSVNKYSELKLQEVNKQLNEQNQQIIKQNIEKTFLVKEIHHRVKNNLQIVISLLRIQSVEIEGPKNRKAFNDSIDRILAMALIHQKLYQNDKLSEVNFKDYAGDLLKSIILSDSKKRKINYTVKSKIERFNLEPMVPIGLIINELATNTIKHAFEESTRDEHDLCLDVKKGTKDDEVIMIYKDSGIWKEYDESKNSFGLSLIDALTEQLDGEYTINKLKTGTEFIFNFKNIQFHEAE